MTLGMWAAGLYSNWAEVIILHYIYQYIYKYLSQVEQPPHPRKVKYKPKVATHDSILLLMCCCQLKMAFTDKYYSKLSTKL